MMANLHADRAELSRFINALFRYADEGSFASLRAFDQTDRTVPAKLIKGVKINGDLNHLIDQAQHAAEAMANELRPIVFAPPICTFNNEDRARLADLANGLTLSVEIDDGDTSLARRKLEYLLGTATIIVESGGEWADPLTGEIFPKLHLHWRLSEPTREADDHAKLRQARDLAARLVGADPTGKPVVHPLRWPGSWNRKGVPRLARIVAFNETSEINLEEALEAVSDAIEAAGLAAVDMPASGTPEAASGLVSSAMAAVPNAGTEVHYDTWMRLGYAVYRATAGTGYGIWEEWSRKSKKFNAGENEAAWRRIGRAIVGSKAPRTIGAGTIFFEAKAAGWERPGPDPPFETDPGWWESVTSGVEENQTRGGRVNGHDLYSSDHSSNSTRQQSPTAQRPSILIQAGRVDLIASEGEGAIVTMGIEVYQRGRELVRPAQQEVPASKGRMTISAGMAKVMHAGMVDLLSQAADWRKYDGRSKKEVAADPPGIVADIILARAGQWSIPTVAGVITTPTLRPDGTILHKPGYDPVTRLYQVVDPSLIPAYIPDRPTEEDAKLALDILSSLLDEFPFVAEVDRSVALSAIITPIVRGAVSVAPLHAIRASTAGTGKSYLTDTASAIATGRPCPVVAISAKPEETESRLIGLLLAAFPLISLDNVNGELGGDLLCQAVERPTVRVRRLGGSDIFEIESRATFYATGNGLRIKGDMTRRTITCNLDAGVERPEQREFTHSPVEDVICNRGKYVAAALTIVRAYIVANKPCKLAPLASFEEWSDLVRSPLVWLGLPDPVETTETAREDDPDLGSLREVVTLWKEVAGLGNPMTVKQLVAKANERFSTTIGEPTDYISPDLRDSLIAVAGFRGEIDNRKLGNWIRSIEGKIVNELRIKRGKPDEHAKVLTWQVL